MCEGFEAVKALRRPPLLSVSPGGETHGKIAVERGGTAVAGYGRVWEPRGTGLGRGAHGGAPLHRLSSRGA